MTLADLLMPLAVVSAEGNLDVDVSPPGRHSCGRRNDGRGGWYDGQGAWYDGRGA